MKVKRKITIDTEKFEVGDVIDFTLNDGEEVQAMAVKQEKDSMLFCMVDCLKKEYAMNKADTNKGGYGDSELRTKLNGEILDRFPDNIRENMVAFENGDYLRLPSEKEIFGCNKYGKDEPDNVQQWEPMKLRRNRRALHGKDGGCDWYWLMNQYKNSASCFASVLDYGYASYLSASSSLGVRPVFVLSEIQRPCGADVNKGKYKMTKDDLKSGMVVQTRGGNLYLCVLNSAFLYENVFIRAEGFLRVDSYNDDLTIKDRYFEHLDIVKVFSAIPASAIIAVNDNRANNNFNLIWERKERKKMTIEKIDGELGYEVEIVSR